MTPNPSPESSLPEHVAAVMRRHSSLGSAIKAGDVGALRTLLEYQKDKGTLDTAILELALVKAAPIMAPAMATVLMDFGASLGLRVEGQDAVQACLSGKNTPLLKMFLEGGVVGPNHAEEDGTTLLMAALQSEQFDVADYLFQQGADVNARKLDFSGGGDTALHLAARQASFQSVIWLIEHGADPSMENADRRQPSEVIPELDKQSAAEWDLDVMFNALEDLKECRANGTPFEIPDRLREMAHKEATPISAIEAQMAAMSAKESAEDNGLGLLPKKKKVGF